MKIERVLVPTDFSPCARQAYGPAADLTRRMGARLDLVHCLGWPAQYSPDGYLGTPGTIEAIRRQGRRLLALEAREPPLAGLAIEPHLLDGVGPEAIEAHCVKRSIDLVVQASHGRSGWRRLLLGSFAERVLRVLSPPVLTIRARDASTPGAPAGPFAPRRILFAYDFSRACGEALEAVRLLAGLHGSKVLVLYVWRRIDDLFPLYGAEGQAVDLELLSSREDFRAKLLQDLAGFAREQLPGIDHECEVLAGEPAPAIVSRAGSFAADLVCMATHGWTGAQRLLLGSVAERVLRTAPCPTLTVRPRR